MFHQIGTLSNLYLIRFCIRWAWEALPEGECRLNGLPPLESAERAYVTAKGYALVAAPKQAELEAAGQVLLAEERRKVGEEVCAAEEVGTAGRAQPCSSLIPTVALTDGSACRKGEGDPCARVL